MDEKDEKLNKEQLIKILNSLKQNTLENNLSLFFCKKRTNGKIIVFEPQLSSNVQKNISITVIDNTVSCLNCNALVPYNPVGSLDGQIEQISIDSVMEAQKIIETFNNVDDIVKDMKNFKIDEIDFYCLRFSYNDSYLYLFRRFSKIKKFRKGCFMKLFHDELVDVESDFLRIDDDSDIVVYDDSLLILNHISLERIFNYRDEFQRQTDEAFEIIKKENKIDNIEQFKEDCLNDVRIMKRFTNIMKDRKLPLFFNNYSKVLEIIKELKLDIKIDEENKKIVYEDKSQLFTMVNLMSDAYFKTMILNNTGVAIIEESLK